MIQRMSLMAMLVMHVGLNAGKKPSKLVMPSHQVVRVMTRLTSTLAPNGCGHHSEKKKGCGMCDGAAPQK